jgi:RNA-directed DNA polymerase
VRDRGVQPAGKLVMAPICEANFPHTSDGFRPERRAPQAVKAVTHALMRGWWVVEADSHRSFDPIDHTVLVSLGARRLRARRVLKLIRPGRQAGVVDQGQWQPPAVGSPQGGGRRPLLATIYWHGLERSWVTRAAGLGELCRYADDLVISCRPQRQAEHALHAVRRILQQRKRQLHPTPTRRVAMAQEGIDCLGCHVQQLRAKHTGKLLPYRWPSQKAMKAIRRARQGLTSRPRLAAGLAAVIGQLTPVIAGWRH